MMSDKQMMKKMLDFNKEAFDNACKNFSMLEEQMEKITDIYMDQTSGMTDEAKKTLKTWTASYKKGVNDYKKAVDEGFKKVEPFFKTEE
ncbi:hypothetical protein D4R89_02530 [bacterium]|nr:MAG: hypothetical protein D4R89_02530 [bacterium]